jgi:quinol monooxygenase YgiN
MIVVERYVSAEAFAAHLADPANAEFNAKLGEILGGGGSTLQLLDPLAW